MTAMPVSEDKAALVSQCLDFCQTLATKLPIFSFALTLGNGFSFTLDTSGKEALSPKAMKKKKTPSTLRRDARRRSEFLKKKLEGSTGDASPQSENVSVEEAVEKVVIEKVFKCDQCKNSFKSENGLKIHAGRSHKKVTLLSSTPERLRQQLEGSASLSASPLLDASREEISLNSDAVEEKANSPPSLQPQPSPPLREVDNDNKGDECDCRIMPSGSYDGYCCKNTPCDHPDNCECKTKPCRCCQPGN